MLNSLKFKVRDNHKTLTVMLFTVMFISVTLLSSSLPKFTVHAAGSNMAQVSGITSVTQVSAGQFHSLFLKSDGTVWAVGNNGSGELGDGTTTQRCTVVQVLTTASGHPALSSVVEIAAGAGFSLARTSDGKVWAWGSNSVNQLGDGTTTSRSYADKVKVAGSPPTDLSGVTGIAAGSEHGLALTSGSIKAWGSNNLGQLGNGTTTASAYATAVSSITDATQVAAGQFHSLALRGSTSGQLKAWGQNTSGQLGNNSNTASSTPVDMRDSLGTIFTNAGYVSGGVDFTVVTTTGGKVWSTGGNGQGQLGTGCSGATNGLVKITSLTGVSKAVGGQMTLHVLAVISSTINGWGYNAYGQVGDGTTTDACSFVQVNDSSGSAVTNFTAVSAGLHHSLGLKSNGTAWSWGDNITCQLGH